jgi:hypothetical protein
MAGEDWDSRIKMTCLKVALRKLRIECQGESSRINLPRETI